MLLARSHVVLGLNQNSFKTCIVAICTVITMITNYGTKLRTKINTLLCQSVHICVHLYVCLCVQKGALVPSEQSSGILLFSSALCFKSVGYLTLHEVFSQRGWSSTYKLIDRINNSRSRSISSDKNWSFVYDNRSFECGLCSKMKITCTVLQIVEFLVIVRLKNVAWCPLYQILFSLNTY